MAPFSGGGGLSWFLTELDFSFVVLSSWFASARFKGFVQSVDTIPDLPVISPSKRMVSMLFFSAQSKAPCPASVLQVYVKSKFLKNARATLPDKHVKPLAFRLERQQSDRSHSVERGRKGGDLSSVHLGGIRPRDKGPFNCTRIKLSATRIGFFTPAMPQTNFFQWKENSLFPPFHRIQITNCDMIPCTAPTAPYCNVYPSMIDASHSTEPLMVKFDPIPALVHGESSKAIMAAFAASKADFFSRSSLIACNETTKYKSTTWLSTFYFGSEESWKAADKISLMSHSTEEFEPFTPEGNLIWQAHTRKPVQHTQNQSYFRLGNFTCMQACLQICLYSSLFVGEW